MSMILSNQKRVGPSRGSIKRVEVSFERPFPGVDPQIVATTLQDPRWPNPNIPDVFAVSIVSVSTTGFIAQIRRVDANSGWGQDLWLNWIAYGPICDRSN